MPSPLQQAKRPVSLLAGGYGHPVHPILVTVPIGAWVASLVFDLASHVVDDPAFLEKGSLWLIAIGVVGALGAAATGFLDLFAIPVGTHAFRTGLVHMGLNLAVTTGYAGAIVWRLDRYEQPGTVQAGQIVLSAVSLTVLTVSGYLGGKLAFLYGVRVADESTQEQAYRPSEDS